MSSYNLYPKLKITQQDYLEYNTYFVSNVYDKVPEKDIKDRLQFINQMYQERHTILNDASILEINKKVKKGLRFDKRFFLSAAFFATILLYFGIKYMKPIIGISAYYNVPKVYNNPWEIILVVLIFLWAWWYEKKSYKRKLITGVKHRMIASIEEYYASPKFQKRK
ncbi:hypothetical protein [uncultured Dokdonia sp.]|uniref:hypothetical protein n=1 Tax=uncultured Dokdonia sp. TaxID=575653 RepID=UPI0026304A35|nr:hypothetical protein [uncultured Dokdonia sp.]